MTCENTKLNNDTSDSTSEVKPIDKRLSRAATWFALLAAVISALGLALALLGYGVSFAAEGLFGMPHSVMFDSSLELIDLASLALGQMGTASVRLLLDFDTYASLYRLTWPVLLLATVLWIGLMFIASPWFRRRLAVRKMAKPAMPARASRVSQYWREGLGMLALLLGTPLFMTLMLVVMAAVFTLLSVISMSGMAAGTAYINEWVLKPGQCYPLVKLSERLRAPKQHEGRGTNKVVHCVAIVKDGKPIARGRVVFMTFKSVILFDPADGAVRKVPTADAVIEVLPAL